MPAVSDATAPAANAAAHASTSTAPGADFMLFLAQLITMQGTGLAQSSAHASVLGGEQPLTILPAAPGSGEMLGERSAVLSETDEELSAEAILAALCLPAVCGL